ncbi:MAG: hypothetical protein PHN80_01815 [Hespellia sp.]|nr:hypothetical protein [Hespellia sp.]
MQESDKTPLTPFDELTTPSYLHLIKLMFSFVSPEERQPLAIAIKFIELKNTVSCFKASPSLLHMQSQVHTTPSLWEMLNEITPYLRPSEQKSIQQITSTLQAVQMMQSMQTASAGESGRSQTDFLKNFLSPEQQEQFKMYENVFQQEFDASCPDPENEKKEGI